MSASIEAAIEAGVSAYVVDGLKKERVKPLPDTAISRLLREGQVRWPDKESPAVTSRAFNGALSNFDQARRSCRAL